MGLYKSDSPVTALRKAIEKTNELLFLEAQRDPDREGMGSTLVAATVEPGYHVRGQCGRQPPVSFQGRLKPDHQGPLPVWRKWYPWGSWSGTASLTGPRKTSSPGLWGSGLRWTADFFEVSLKKDDCVLLCSDGLSNMAEESLIGSILAAPAALKEKTSRLIQAANENGGKDNIAVILIEPQVSEVGV